MVIEFTLFFESLGLNRRKILKKDTRGTESTRLGMGRPMDTINLRTVYGIEERKYERD